MKRAMWFGFAAIALLLLGLTLDRVADRGRFATAYSTYGSGPRGTRALYLLAQELVSPSMRWAQDLARLPSRAVLVALGGCDAAMARPVSRYERQELARWVQQGGVLIVAGARDYLPQVFGVRFAFDARCETRWSTLLEENIEDPAVSSPAADGGVAELDAGAPGALPELPAIAPGETTWAVPLSATLQGLPVVPFRDPGELVVTSARGPEVLLGDPRRDADGRETDIAPLAVTVRHGAGRVIVLASASMLQNSDLATSDGGELFVRLLRTYGGGAPLLFDEYHLGIGERRSLMRYLRQMGAAPLALQLLLLIALLLWRGGARFGSVQPAPPPPPPASASFVIALGQLYERSNDARGALELIARDAWARIAEHHHVELGPPAKLAAELTERGAHEAAAAVRVIEAAAKGGADGLPARVREIDAALSSALSR